MPMADLTPREVDVLRLAARGMKDAQIAHELHGRDGSPLSAHHVAHVMASARHKLGASSRTHAVAMAVRAGLA
jgi:DNA-binding CsgD family transcriptional regulator